MLGFLKDADTRAYEKAKKRLGTVTTEEASLWADSGLWAVQEALDVYRRTGDRGALQTARTGSLGLLAAVDSLLDRRH